MIYNLDSIIIIYNYFLIFMRVKSVFWESVEKDLVNLVIMIIIRKWLLLESQSGDGGI